MDAAATLRAGFVLHARAYRESSALLEILTREQGRVGAVARGVRGRRGTGVLQQFQPYAFAWRGQRELATLTGWETAGRGYRLQGTALVSGLYLNEVLVRVLERHDPHPEVFDAYVAALDGLGDDAGREAALRVFESRLLTGLGYGLDFATTSTGDGIEPGRRYVYRPEVGIEPAAADAGSADTVAGATLLALAAGRLHEPLVLLESKRLMRRAMDQLLGGRRIVSRSLLRR